MEVFSFFCQADNCDNVTTHTVSTFDKATDAELKTQDLCKAHAARAVFGHSDSVYARSVKHEDAA